MNGVPGLGHRMPAGSTRKPGRRPRQPRTKSTSTTTTVTSEIPHVTRAGVVARWNPLTQPHQAHSANAEPASATYRRTTTCHHGLMLAARGPRSLIEPIRCLGAPYRWAILAPSGFE